MVSARRKYHERGDDALEGKRSKLAKDVTNCGCGWPLDTVVAVVVEEDELLVLEPTPRLLRSSGEVLTDDPPRRGSLYGWGWDRDEDEVDGREVS